MQASILCDTSVKKINEIGNVFQKMKGRYRIKTGWRIFLLIGCPLLAALFVYLFIFVINATYMVVAGRIFIAAISLGMTGLMLYGIGDAIIGYYEIGDDFIAQRTIFGKKTIRLSDIQGVSMNDKYIRLVPVTGKKGLNVSLYIEKSDDIGAWAYSRFEDLDTQKAEEEDIEVLKEVTREIPALDHDNQLAKARRAAKYLNWAGYGTGLLAFFYSHPYDAVVVSTMVVPVVIILAIRWSKGFLRYNGTDKSRYPIMAFVILMPIAGLGIRAMFDFNILDFGNLWIEAIAVDAALIAMAMWSSNELSFKGPMSTFTLVFMSVLFYGYAISSMTIINCRFDSGDYQPFKAAILNKEISDGKVTTYYLDLSPWGPRTEHEQVSVDKNLFNRANVGDTVEVYLYEGRLKAKWFEVRM